MRRLIQLAIAILLGIRARVHQQHIADLEKMLSDLVSARDAIEAEIAETTRQLLAARQATSHPVGAVQTPALSPE